MVRRTLRLEMTQPQTVVAQPVCPYYNHSLLRWQRPEFLTGVQRKIPRTTHCAGGVNTIRLIRPNLCRPCTVQPRLSELCLSEHPDYPNALSWSMHKFIFNE